MRRPMQQEEEKVADLTPMLDVVFIMLIWTMVLQKEQYPIMFLQTGQVES